ncbi:MAG: hypothetical protein PVG39_03295 [Desulfobacteraceae bacterium]|jgi:hypothetical protein
MISEKFSLREMVENISSCGFYEMIHKINLEATEAERISIKYKKASEADSPEETYAKDLKALINFLRYDIFLGNMNTQNGVLFSYLKRNLKCGVENGIDRMEEGSDLPN